MKYRPILENGPGVRSILAGNKTQTRRVVKPQPQAMIHLGIHRATVRDTCYSERIYEWGMENPVNDRFVAECCPHGRPGDKLWVRETWFADDYRLASGPYKKPSDFDFFHLYFRADGEVKWEEGGDTEWKPSIHMPRWASRITLEIISVRVERLNDISEADAKAEGVDGGCLSCGENQGRFGCGCGCQRPCYKESFCWLWNEIHGHGSWDINPWVWRIEFKRVEK